jgi:hypothetical protein
VMPLPQGEGTLAAIAKVRIITGGESKNVCSQEAD